MKAFRIYENQQSEDSDGWNHWISQATKGYRLTQEGVDTLIQELLAEKRTSLATMKEWNPHITDWSNSEEEIATNTKQFWVGTRSEEAEEEPIFGIEEIELL